MQEFDSCKISSRISESLQKALAVLGNQTSHWQHTTLLPPPSPLIRGYIALFVFLWGKEQLFSSSPRNLGPRVSVTFVCCPSRQSWKNSPWEYRHILWGSVTSSWHRILLLSSLVPHFPHTYLLLWMVATSIAFFFFTYQCKKHLNEHLWCPGPCICHWGYSTELCRYGPSSHGASHPKNKYGHKTRSSHHKLLCWVALLVGEIHSDRNRTNIGFSITIYIKDTSELKKAVLACKTSIALKMFISN